MEGHDPKDFVLNRELSEVHLLLDNLSSSPDKTFDLLTVDDRQALDRDWLEQVCRISWPPPDASQQAADQAALLIRVKDRLNTMAKPASGASIAFTLLVTQEEVPSNIRQTGPDTAPTRRSLARDAYPGLIRKAAAFRLFISSMACVLFLLLVFTCLVSWYVAFGTATLAQGADAQTALATAEKRVTDAEAGTGDNPGDRFRRRQEAIRLARPPAALVPPAAATPAAASPATRAAGDDDPQTALAVATYVVGLCDRAQLIPTVASADGPVRQFESVSQMQACDARTKARRTVHSVDRLLISWMKAIPPLRVLKSQPADTVASFQETLLYASSVLHIMASSVLPVFYGILGAAAAVVRSLTRKIKASTLAPRDLLLSWQQLGLGAVMGACIGLFVAQPSGSSDTPGLIGAVALSSSALSFVAGFGVDQVFESLEALIKRIFSGDPAKA